MRRFLVVVGLACALLAARQADALKGSGRVSASGGVVGYAGADVLITDPQFGAACNGTTDDAAAIQAAIDYVSGISGALIIPGGVTCGVGAGGLTAKSNVTLVGPGKLKAVSGITNWIFGTASAVTNVTINGVLFDLDQKSPVPAVSLGSTSNAGIAFVNNVVTWNADGDPATGTNTTAFSLVTIKSGAPAAGATVQSQVIGNRIEGTNVDAQNDTCLTVELNANVLAQSGVIANNSTDFCGGYGLLSSGGVIANNALIAHDSALNVASGQTVVTGNSAQATTNGPGILASNSPNTFYVNNNVNVLSAGPAMTVPSSGSMGGVWILGGYYADGVYFDQSSTGTYTHCQVRDIVCNTGGARPCVAVENATDHFTVMGVTDVTSTSGTHSSIKFTNVDSTADKGIIIAANNLTPSGAGTRTGITLDGTSGGFRGVLIANNQIGIDGGAVDVGIAITGSPTDLAALLLDGNDLTNATDALSGFGTDAAIEATTIGASNRGLNPDDLAPIVKVFENRTASIARYTVVEPSSGANDAVKTGVAGTLNAVGCSLGPNSASSGAGLRVAIAGVSRCLVDADGGAGSPNVTRGDALTVHPSTDGKLVQAAAGDRVFGYAQETSTSDGSMRVLIAPRPKSSSSVGLALYFNGAANCGAATQYAGNFVSNANCNGTVGNVQWVAAAAMTITAIAGNQAGDATCTLRFTVNKNGSDDTTMQCSSVNQVACSDSTGTISVAAGDLIAIKVEDTGGTCTDAIGATATVNFTQ